MKKIMKKEYIIKIFIIILLITFCRLSYMVQFYYRFNKDYKNKGFTVYVATFRRSPDNTYEIGVSYLISENKIRYIHISVRDETFSKDKESRLLYFDQWKYDNLVMEDDVPIQLQNGSIKTDEFVSIQWIDDETIQIEDKILNVKKDTYDFRKDW